MNEPLEPRAKTLSALFHGMGEWSFWKVILWKVGHFLLAFLFGRAVLPFGIYPFAIALLCAAETQLFWLLAGTVVAACFLGKIGWILMLTAGTAIALRFLCGRLLADPPLPDFHEKLPTRVAISLIASSLPALYRLVAGGFRMYDAAGLLLSLAATGTLTFLYSLARKRKEMPRLFPFGVLAVAASLVFALSKVTLGGFSLGVVLGFYGTLLAGSYFGAVGGCVGGVVLGFSCMPMLAPAYALSGLLFGVLKKISIPLAASWSLTLTAVYTIYTQGMIAFYTDLPDWLLAAGALLLTARFARSKEAKNAAEAPVEATSHLTAERNRFAEARWNTLTRALGSLSHVFAGVAEKMKKPSVYAVRCACDTTVRQVCGSCPRQKGCRAGSPTGIVCAVERYTTALERGETVAADPACAYADTLTEALSEAYGRLLETAIEGNRTEIFALDYAAMAKLMEETLRANEVEFLPDEDKTRAARSAFRLAGYTAEEVTVYGRRQITLVAEGVRAESGNAGEAELLRRLGEVCGVAMLPPKERFADGKRSFTLSRRPQLSLLFAQAGEKKAGEAVSGDTVTAFSTEDGHRYLLISDGMGSGRDAAMSAGICRSFFEKMLSAGGSRKLILEMLNDFIRTKSTENFATVDLLDVDVLTGQAVFLKSGAAPSYIFRNGKLYAITSGSLPVGVSRTLNAEEISCTLLPGDLVLMMSDGIMQSFENAKWLEQLLVSEWVEDLSIMAHKILLAAATHDPKGDDRTVALFGVKAYQDA